MTAYNGCLSLPLWYGMVLWLHWPSILQREEVDLNDQESFPVMPQLLSFIQIRALKYNQETILQPINPSASMSMACWRNLHLRETHAIMERICKFRRGCYFSLHKREISLSLSINPCCKATNLVTINVLIAFVLVRFGRRPLRRHKSFDPHPSLSFDFALLSLRSLQKLCWYMTEDDVSVLKA